MLSKLTVRTALGLLLAFSTLTASVAPAQVRGDRADTQPATGFSVEGTVSSVNYPIVSGSAALVTLLEGLFTFDTKDARITTADGRAGTIADVRPGVRILAILSTRSTGMPKAETIVVTSDTSTATFRANVESVDVAALTFGILGTRVTVTRETSFGGPDGRTQTLADLRVGDPVLVIAENRERVLTALRVLVLGRVPDPAVERLRGVVESIDTSLWKIKTVSTTAATRSEEVVVTSATRIVGEPRVGDTVDVLGTRDSAGRLTAQIISKVTVAPPPAGMTRFEGTVTQLPSVRGGVWKIDDTTVVLAPGASTTPGIVVGDRVRATGMPLPDGFLAHRIEKL